MKAIPGRSTVKRIAQCGDRAVMMKGLLMIHGMPRAARVRNQIPTTGLKAVTMMPSNIAVMPVPLRLAIRRRTKAISARMPPSPSLSARITKMTYLTHTTSRIDQKIIEMIPMTSPWVGRTAWFSIEKGVEHRGSDVTEDDSQRSQGQPRLHGSDRFRITDRLGGLCHCLPSMSATHSRRYGPHGLNCKLNREGSSDVGGAGGIVLTSPAPVTLFSSHVSVRRRPQARDRMTTL